MLWALAIPFAGVLLVRLLLGSDRVVNLLHEAGHSFLIPFLR
jgi:uncharacterized membrane protein YqaE (UPF0057 family)